MSLIDLNALPNLTLPHVRSVCKVMLGHLRLPLRPSGMGLSPKLTPLLTQASPRTAEPVQAVTLP